MGAGGDDPVHAEDPASSSGAGLDSGSEGSDPSIATDFLREVARAPAVAPDSAGDLSGRTLGRYRVISRLGRGAMGVVYAAEDEVLLRPMAIKVLLPYMLGDADRRRRFLREARAAASAAHPNIAAVYDVVDTGDLVFIAMERVMGATLRDTIVRAGGRGLPLSEVARIGHAIALGLARAHEAGVIHRDLKPDNVMIGAGGEVKILDFGVAKLRDDRPLDNDAQASGPLTEEGQLLGTPSYMAPEQARGLAVDGRADIFSLGVILYEMATGVRPFTGATTAAVLVAVAGDEPTPPSRLNPAVTPELSRIIARCLQKRAEGRYATAGELADDLARLHAGRTAEAKAGARALNGRLRFATWGLAAIGALSFATLALPRLGASSHAAQPASAPASISPLAQPGAKLACPALEATEAVEPTSWLGAAAASLACRRARSILGGDAAHVIVPAALLDLPTTPREDLARDPFSSEGARPRALAAARTRAAAYLDGSVDRRPEGFRVRLVLKDASDHEIGHGEGAGLSLHQAVRAAMAPLVRPEAIPLAGAVDPEVATWSGIRDTGLSLAITDWELASLSGVGLREEEAKVAPRKAEIGPRWEALEADLASAFGEGLEAIQAPPVDRSSTAAFARSAPVHALLNPRADVAALAGEAGALAAAEPSPMGRAALAFAEAQLRSRAGDLAKANALLLPVIQEDPTSPAWDTLTMISKTHAGQGVASRGYAAWWPEAAEAWNILSISDEWKYPGEPLRDMRRAHVLAPGTPLFALHESMQLVERGRREEARAIAAELLSPNGANKVEGASNSRPVAGEYVLTAVEASSARVGAALARARKVLSSLPAFGGVDVYVATIAMDLAVLLGRAPEVAEEFERTFLEPDPPRLHRNRNVPGRVAAMCALAPSPAARRCFARLKGLIAEGFFREEALPNDAPFIQGAEAYARGDYLAATAAWRPIARMPMSNQRNLLPDAFERAGEVDLAERVDVMGLGGNGPFNGVSLAHFRQARRLLARGDRAQGEKLAQRVIEAWSLADAPVPAVAELRRLLAEKRSK